MRRVSMTTRDELIAALTGRYLEVGRVERGRILGLLDRPPSKEQDEATGILLMRQ
jgi:hypothetical protein